MTITLAFDTDNDSMADPCDRAEELLRIMQQATHKVTNGDTGKSAIMDRNGNRIGTLHIMEDE